MNFEFQNLKDIRRKSREETAQDLSFSDQSNQQDLQFWQSLSTYKTSEEWVMKKIQKKYAERVMDKSVE